MATYSYYDDENGKTVYIKNIDYANGEIEFTEEITDALDDRDGYYANATKDLLKRHFSKKYPKMANLEVDARW